MRGPGLPSLFILTGRSMTSTPRCWCPGARLHPAGRRAPVGGPARPRRRSGPAAGARGQVLRSSACGGGAHAEPPLETGTGSALPPGRRTRRAPGARSPLTPASPSQGTLIQHLKEFSLHGDMTSSDVILYYTTVRVPAASLLPGPGRPSAAPRHASAGWPSPVPAALPAPQACRPLASLRRSSLPASAPPLGALSAWGIPEKPSTLTTC